MTRGGIGDFADMMGDTVVLTAPDTLDRFGQPQFTSSGVECQARWVDRRERVRDTNGTVIEASGQLWVASTGVAPAAGWRVTLPDGTVRPVESVERYPDERGAHHVKLLMGF